MSLGPPADVIGEGNDGARAEDRGRKLGKGGRARTQENGSPMRRNTRPRLGPPQEQYPEEELLGGIGMREGRNGQGRSQRKTEIG